MPDLSFDPVTPDRDHTLRGRRSLEWFFSNRRWVRLQSPVLRVAYALRPLPEGESAIQFLILASKRDMKRAHDRNRAKRWIRAAIAQTPSFAQIERQFPSRQALIMLHCAVTPDSIKYSDILAAVTEAAEAVVRRVVGDAQRESNSATAASTE